MNIGSTHSMAGSFQVEALSTVVLQVPPISAQTMDDVNKNIDQILDWMDKASFGFPGFDLIVTAEFALQGCGPYWKDVMLDYNGDEIQRLKDKCKELDVWGIFCGVVKEFKGRKCCNLAFTINNEGNIVQEYVKMNPWLPAEQTHPGWECPVVEGPKGSKLGLIICADGDYPEIWREAAYNGANIIVRVAHYMAPWDQAWEITNKAGAYFNQAYVVAANCVGFDESYAYFGDSMILNPDGTIITKAPKGLPWMIKADLYPQIIDKMRAEQATSNYNWSFDKRGASHPSFGGTGAPLSEYNAYKGRDE